MLFIIIINTERVDRVQAYYFEEPSEVRVACYSGRFLDEWWAWSIQTDIINRLVFDMYNAAQYNGREVLHFVGLPLQPSLTNCISMSEMCSGMDNSTDE
jgi:hypothetical protein